MNITVLCFDRDLTVDVNFDSHEAHMAGGPEDAEPVPLAWVKHYAHAVDGVDVWATGNQHLRREAAIPGMREAAELWSCIYDRDIESVYENHTFGDHYKPGRRDGLRVIRDVYDHLAGAEDSLTFVVIDDADLRDMADEWGDHYFAWDFVEADEWAVEDPAFTGTPAQSSDCDESLERNHTELDVLAD